LDLAQPIPGLDLNDGAAWLVASLLENPTDAAIASGINALIETPETEQSLEQIPDEAEAVPGSSRVEFEGVPDRVSLSRSTTLPGDIVFTGMPDLSPIASIAVELKPLNDTGTPLRRQVPMNTLERNYGCSPSSTECVVPASATLALFEDVVPSIGPYALKVSALDSGDVIVDAASQEIELTLF
ncbi:MAG: hypothetical protein AAFY15_16240, partial [Cyanobacteria bacterium J06648_11]